MAREDAVRDWKRLKYLLAIARVQRDHMETLKEQQAFLRQGLRYNDVAYDIQSLRDNMRPDEFQGNNYSLKMKSALRPLIKRVMGIDTGKREAFIFIDSKNPRADREKRGGAYHFNIKVGYMWKHKVYRRLYKGTTLHKQGWLILAADQVRVNDRNMSLYTVKAYNPETDETTHGYVAQTKTEKRHTAFGKTVKQAVSRANEMLSDEINKGLGLQERNNND